MNLERSIGSLSSNQVLAIHAVAGDHEIHIGASGRAPDSVGRGPLVISEEFPRLTRTALDVGGPCVGAFG